MTKLKLTSVIVDARSSVRLAGIALKILLFLTGVLPAKSLKQSVAESDLVVIGRVNHIELGPVVPFATTQRTTPQGNVISVDSGPVPFGARYQTFDIGIKIRLKGGYTQSIKLNFSPSRVPNVNGLIKPLEEGSLGLFLLNKADGDNWRPNDPQVLYIPLSDDIRTPTTGSSTVSSPPDNSAVTAAIVQLLLSSLSDVHVRVPVMYALRTVEDDAVVTAARAVLDDSDVNMQVSACFCLAYSQIVDAIPRIAQIVDRKAALGQSDLFVLNALDLYETPAATSYLNELLLDPASEWVRYRAATTLNQKRLADKSSIPYLIKALNDPGIQGQTAYLAHRMLHALVPVLGSPKDRNSFMASDRSIEIQAAQAWWESHSSERNTQADMKPTSKPQP